MPQMSRALRNKPCVEGVTGAGGKVFFRFRDAEPLDTDEEPEVRLYHA